MEGGERGVGGGGGGKRYKNSLFPTLTTSEEKLGLRLVMKHKDGVEQNEGGAGRERAQGRWRDTCRSVEWPLLYIWVICAWLCVSGSEASYGSGTEGRGMEG